MATPPPASAGSADILGILGFALAVMLAILKVVEYLAKAKFRVEATWGYDAGASRPRTLCVYISNTGRGTDTVRELRFGHHENPREGYWSTSKPVKEALPITLGHNQTTPEFVVESSLDDRGRAVPIADAAISHVAVVNARGDWFVFPVRPQGGGPRRSSSVD